MDKTAKKLKQKRRAESRSRSKRGIYEDFNSNKNKRIVLNNDNDEKGVGLKDVKSRRKQ